ncbi:unnamed protein product [marine sediment metagenome]|uniref:Extradiol ring-cleavage dioxygenase LigAB LigA subunit domain-containing protein n=1 Tax=marine sediment metagenome TaxID=412755 RepID=X1T2D7_9ZZZZ
MSTEAMLGVLERAADNPTFFGQLATDPQTALKGLGLTSEEEVALTNGDQGFIESRIGGKVDKRIEEKVLIPLLSRERW